MDDEVAGRANRVSATRHHSAKAARPRHGDLHAVGFDGRLWQPLVL